MRALVIVPDDDAEACARAFASGADAVIADAAAAGAGAPTLYVRLGGLDEPGAAQDIAAAARLGARGVAFRAAGGADVQRLGAWLAVAEARAGLPDGALRILAFATETPEAVLGLPTYRDASPRLAALIVTAAPLALTLRADEDSGPVRLARSLAVIAARAAGVPVFDATGGDPARARADGFDGVASILRAGSP